jgi:hypothetical protein
MTTVDDIKLAITGLSARDFAELQAWYEAYAAQLWDEQIEADVQAGRLDKLAEEAVQAFRSGQVSEL